MTGLLLLLAAQVATVPASAAPDKPQSFSILVPVANEPCVRKQDGKDIVVCGNPLPSQKLPYPQEIVPDGPTPSNPELSGTGALAAESTPCAVAAQGCTVGFGPPIVPIIKGAVDLAKRAFAKEPDKSRRVAIPLDDSDAPTGRIEP